MNGKPGVLAVMDEAEFRIGNLREIAGFEPSDVQRQLREARATVERLAKTATEVRAAHRELPSADHAPEVRAAGEARIGRAHYALDAALAAFHGGQP